MTTTESTAVLEAADMFARLCERIEDRPLDLAAATGLSVDPTDAALHSALPIAVTAVARTGDGVALFRTLLGRPPGFCRPLFS